jgi:hypothetical protein
MIPSPVLRFVIIRGDHQFAPCRFPLPAYETTKHRGAKSVKNPTSEKDDGYVAQRPSAAGSSAKPAAHQPSRGSRRRAASDFALRPRATCMANRRVDRGINVDDQDPNTLAMFLP